MQARFNWCQELLQQLILHPSAKLNFLARGLTLTWKELIILSTPQISLDLHSEFVEMLCFGE